MRTIILSVIILIVVGGVFWFLSNKTESPNLIVEKIEEKNTQKTDTILELEIEIIKEGSGPKSKTGDTLSVHYTGTLQNGTKFDSSLDRGTPFEFTLGQNRVIQGWERGMLGMQVGEKRKLAIPSELAYGSASPSPLIPANSVLIFEIELLEIK